jgi:hypothetical protein
MNCTYAIVCHFFSLFGEAAETPSSDASTIRGRVQLRVTPAAHKTEAQARITGTLACASD